jgi:S1-C subfamily serine protease/Tfp pilus assembly protein PilF/DNA-binding beta-propeller fold protein YncE
MFSSRVLTACVVVLVVVGGASADERDLREQFGTNNSEAAKQIQQAIQLSQAKKKKEALAALEEALKLDKQCQMAYFQKALILNDLGDIEESFKAYKICLSDDVRRTATLSATAAVNLAINNAKLKEYDEAGVWFTRAILEDYDNTVRQRGKAYRNLAIALREQDKHLAAALAIAFAFEDKAPNCDLRMVRDFFDKAENDEGARLLHFSEKSPTLAKRAQAAKLDAVDIDKTISEPVADLLPDPRGRYVVAFVTGADHYYVIATEDKPAIQKVTAPRPLAAVCLVEGHLYVVSKEGAKVEKIEVESGKVAASYPLKAVPNSLAVFPAQGKAYFPADDVVNELDLASGTVTKTKIPGQVVAGHPNQRFLYSYVKPDRRGGQGGRVIIEGNTLYFVNRGFDWLQSTLFKSVVVPKGLLLAEVRDNAAANASRMTLSPDGNWVALVGGGGWRSAIKGNEAGYGVAALSAHNLEHVQGFFKTDAYPQGACFNPVTSQIAAVRGDDAKVYHLADPTTPVTLAGKFTGPGAWSGNGRYLVLANNGGGVSLFENKLSEEEQKSAAAWWKEIKVVPVATVALVTVSYKPAEGYDRFAVATPTHEELAKALAKAADSARTDRPGAWQDYDAYAKDPSRKVVEAVLPQIKAKTDLGLAIFQLKKAVKDHEFPPARLQLAEALRLSDDQQEEAEKAYVAVVQADAGRSDLSWRALNALASMLAEKDKEMSALHCLAASLYLDKVNPQTIAQAAPLLKKNMFEAEADKFAKMSSGVATPSADLPKLPKPGEGDAKKLTAAEIYRKAVASVVLIKTGKGSGSGVCVGTRDFILTNHHVIDGDGAIEVYPFTLKDKEPVRMAAVRATVVFQSEKEDVAVLKLEKAPEYLQPLPVAAASPSAGDKVYAIGSPGLGKEILEQSISEGLVSSKSRKIDDVPYLQHSAAVNPGNSGGPLLDEFGRVAGIVTLKARLENVSFAIPVETIRTIFKSPGQ